MGALLDVGSRPECCWAGVNGYGNFDACPKVIKKQCLGAMMTNTINILIAQVFAATPVHRVEA